MKNKRILSVWMVFVMLFATVFSTGNYVAAAGEENTAKIVVYVAAQGKNAEGTTVEVKKTPVQVEEGTTADVAIKQVLDASDYKDKYEIPDSDYGPFLESINGMGTVDAGNNTWYYWSFYVNGNYATTGIGSYVLKDNDKISLIYSYEDDSTEAADFVDDETKNPEVETASVLAAVKGQQQVLADAVYKAQFGDGSVPGIENANALYTVFSLLRAGYEKPEFYGAVYGKIERQLKEIKETGKTYDEISGKDITETSIVEGGYAEHTYAKIVLCVTAMGKDASDIGGFNLIEKMAQKSVYEASNVYTREATMLLALDCKEYPLPAGENYVTRGELVGRLVADVENQIGTSIAWGMVDSAAMAIQPLAKYQSGADETVDTEAVKTVCTKAIDFLASMQSTDGLIGDSYSPNNVWTLSQVLVTLGEFGISPVSEADGSDFIKNGKTLLDAASAFVDAEKKTVDEALMSYQPEQLLRGLNACARVIAGEKETVYQIATTPTVTVPEEKPEKPVETMQPSATPTETPAGTVAPSATPSVSPTAVPSESPQNKVKKIQFAKKTVTLKKGKTTKLVLKVTAQNKKKATTDRVKKIVITPKNSKVKIAKTWKVKKGKIVFSVIGEKKGRYKMTVWVGKKKAKTTLIVK